MSSAKKVRRSSAPGPDKTKGKTRKKTVKAIDGKKKKRSTSVTLGEGAPRRSPPTLEELLDYKYDSEDEILPSGRDRSRRVALRTLAPNRRVIEEAKWDEDAYYTTKLDHKSQKQVIPKEIHYIWIGGALPKEYADGIAATIANCPTWQVNLWISKKFSFSEEDYYANEGTAATVGATVGIIEDFVDLYGTDIEVWALDLEWSWNDGPVGKEHKPNFGAISDIVRAIILATVGGVYVDTDCGVLKGFDKFKGKPKFGFMCAAGSEEEPDATSPSNCVMITIPRGLYIGYYRQWFNDDYEKAKFTYRSDEALYGYFRGRNGTYDETRVKEMTIQITGPEALKACGWKHLTVKKKDVGEYMYDNGCTGLLADMAVDKEKHFRIEYDNTWLKGLKKLKTTRKKNKSK